MSLKIRKTAKADLENKRPLFLILGLVLSLTTAYTALEWTVSERPLMVVEDGRSLPQIVRPATENGEPVSITYIIPLQFKK